MLCAPVLVIAFRQATARSLLNEQLIQAVESGDATSALRLLEQGADPNTPAGAYKTDDLWLRIFDTFVPHPAASVLHRAVEESGEPGSGKQMTRLVQALIAQGADVRRQDSEGRTVLMRAALYGSPECLQAVIDSGVDVNEREPSGVTVLHELKEIQALKSKGAGNFMDARFGRGYREKIAVLEKVGAKE
jgi:ankyrin repeat protein